MRHTTFIALRKGAVTLTLLLTAAGTFAQSRYCVIDEQTGRLHCGWLADSQGFRIADPAPAMVAPVMNPPVIIDNRSRREIEFEREQRYAFEQQRLQVQERVNALFLEVLGRDADIVTLRRVTGQVMEGRALADVRIELATSQEARSTINQIYREVLRREADLAGLNAQVAGLRSGMSMAQIRQSIQDSPEARNRR